MCYVMDAINRYEEEDRFTGVMNNMMAEVASINRANGWYEEERTFGEDIALLHSEVSEMFEGFRNHDLENVHEEAADILIRLLDTAYRYKIDLVGEFRKKCAKNRTRGYKHGGKAL